MAKFPFLSLETDCVDLGDVVVGQTAEAFVRFGNHSQVPASFFLAAGPGSHDGAIIVQPARWVRTACAGLTQAVANPIVQEGAEMSVLTPWHVQWRPRQGWAC